MKFAKILIALGLCLVMPLSSIAATNKGKSASGRGASGQILTVTPARAVVDGQTLTVVGKKYNRDVGIYVAFCEMPKPNTKPEHCYGGINIKGSSKGSIWITSHKPWFVPSSAVKKFTKLGSFQVKVTVARMIDETDCKVTKCAVVTRADHTDSENRSADVIVPITFK